MLFKAVKKEDDITRHLDPKCKCALLAASTTFATLTPYTPWGKYIRANVEAMLKRVKVNAPQANLVPYGYEIEAADEDDQKDDEPAMGGPDVEAQLLMLRGCVQEIPRSESPRRI